MEQVFAENVPKHVFCKVLLAHTGWGVAADSLHGVVFRQQACLQGGQGIGTVALHKLAFAFLVIYHLVVGRVGQEERPFIIGLNDIVEKGETGV